MASVTYKIGTDLEYAARIEFGFTGPDSLGRVYNQPAQPYLRPAFDTKRTAAVNEIGRVLGRLAKAAGR